MALVTPYSDSTAVVIDGVDPNQSMSKPRDSAPRQSTTTTTTTTPATAASKVGKGLPVRRNFGASSSANELEEESLALPLRVSKKFTISVPVVIDPASDVGCEKCVDVGEAMRAGVRKAAGDLGADAEHLLVESIKGKAYLTRCGKSIAVSIEGVEGLNSQAAIHVDANGAIASQANFMAHANEITEGALYLADDYRKDNIRKRAPGVTEIHTAASLKAHELPHKVLGLHVHCESPVWDTLQKSLPADLKAELNRKRIAWNRYVNEKDHGMGTEIQDVHVKVTDKATYNKAKAHLINQSMSQAVHHVNLTTMKVKLADAFGDDLAAVPATLQAAAPAVKSAHTSAIHYGTLDLNVTFYQDVSPMQ